MGARGPKPTPPEVQAAREKGGTRTNHHAKGAAGATAASGTLKVPKLPLASPECPEYLTGNARWLWEKLAPTLIEHGLLTVVGVPQLMALCEAFKSWRLYEGLAEETGAAGAVVLGYRNAADRSRDAFVKLSARFGMDPASVGNITPMQRKTDQVAESRRLEFFKVPGGKAG